MWLMLWTYLAFMELLIIWAGDLPREIRWYLPRLHGGWAAVGVGLALLQFALPLLARLQRRIKDRGRERRSPSPPSEPIHRTLESLRQPVAPEVAVRSSRQASGCPAKCLVAIGLHW